jgi:hypothetical protein
MCAKVVFFVPFCYVSLSLVVTTARQFLFRGFGSIRVVQQDCMR